MNTKLKISLVFLITAAFWACSGEGDTSRKKTDTKKDQTEKKEQYQARFNADSAYAFIEKQVSFGPRVPNTEAHDLCGLYLQEKLREYADRVEIQPFGVNYLGKTPWRLTNIIATFNPEATDRILLCAHWDTRPQADEDPNHPDQPADGADDGGSGVGVLLELARQLHLNPVNYGVDIILFDGEDAGIAGGQKENTWCLGSQHWSKNPHQSNYTANFGVLLDMVGAHNPTFAFELFSKENAGYYQKSIWSTAQDLGYGNMFISMDGTYITDDHFYIIQNLGIPTVDIINLAGERSSFGNHWHTLNDNMKVISKNSLQAVGATVEHVLRKPLF